LGAKKNHAHNPQNTGRWQGTTLPFVRKWNIFTGVI